MARSSSGAGVSQVSLVVIRQAPKIVQAASQAMMTQTASVTDSGSRAAPGPPTPPLTPGSPVAIGSPDGSRRAMAMRRTNLGLH